MRSFPLRSAAHKFRIFMVALIILFYPPSNGYSYEANNTYIEHLTQYLINNYDFTTNIEILDRGYVTVGDYKFIFFKVRDDKGHKGVFYIDLNSSKVYDHKPSIYELYNISHKISERLFVLIKNATDNETFEIIIQINSPVDKSDIKKIKKVGAFVSRSENRFIFASASKNQIFKIAEFENVQLITANIPAKPLEKTNNKETFIKKSTTLKKIFFPIVILIMVIIFVIHIWTNKKGDNHKNEKK